MRHFLIRLVKLYKITPINTHNLCRHYPTCSDYMIESLTRFGTIKGLKLGMKRLLNCRPGGSSGYDPVPKERLED